MSYQAEKFHVARSVLMLPHARGEAADIAEAFFNVDLGLTNFQVPDDFNEQGKGYLRELEEFMDTTGVQDPHGRGAYEVKAEGFTHEEKHRISTIINELAWFFEEYDRPAL